MQAGDAHVVNAGNGIAHDFRGDGGFLRNRQVAGPGADHGDGPHPLRQGLAFDHDAPSHFMVDHVRKNGLQGCGVLRSCAGDEYPMVAFNDFGRDSSHVGRGSFPCRR